MLDLACRILTLLLIVQKARHTGVAGLCACQLEAEIMRDSQPFVEDKSLAAMQEEAVARFVHDIEIQIAGDVDREAMRSAGNRLLMAFFGRVGVVDERFLPAEIVLPQLLRACSALAALTCAGSAEHVRSDIVASLTGPSG